MMMPLLMPVNQRSNRMKRRPMMISQYWIMTQHQPLWPMKTMQMVIAKKEVKKVTIKMVKMMMIKMKLNHLKNKHKLKQLMLKKI